MHVLFLPVQIYFTVLLGLHAGCSSQGDGGVVIFVHVTSDKRLCSLAFGLQPVCPALSTLALEKASTVCWVGKGSPSGLFTDDETLKIKSSLYGTVLDLNSCEGPRTS